jgi:hypothetical protein
VPKLRAGSFFMDWLLTHRRRVEQALVTVVATAHPLGVSTRRVERLAEQLGVKSLSCSQASEMARHLDAHVAAFRERPLGFDSPKGALFAQVRALVPASFVGQGTCVLRTDQPCAGQQGPSWHGRRTSLACSPRSSRLRPSALTAGQLM